VQYFTVLPAIGLGAALAVGAVRLERAGARARNRRLAVMSPEDQQVYLATRLRQREAVDIERAREATVVRRAYAEAQATRRFGVLRPDLTCPVCGSGHSVRTKPVGRVRRGRGGKAVRLIARLSRLAASHSRDVSLTMARCDSCSNSWNL
jgi:hypothetical protein